MDFLTSALTCAERGWKVVPLHSASPDGSCSCPKNGDCPSPGKHPRITAWQNNASSDEAQIMAWADQWPESNIGIKLGPDSGIIDIEYDDEQGKAIAEKLMGECYTPTFSSGRSVHRIFKYDSDLPDKAMEKISGLEVRIGGGGNGAQSVFPASQHASGKLYQWLPGLSPEDVDVMEIPDRVLAVIANGMEDSGPVKKTRDDWNKSVSATEGTRNDTAASFIGGLLRGTMDIEDEGMLFLYMQSAKGLNAGFSPPLSDAELETTFNSILRKERLRRIKEDTENVLAAPPETAALDAATGRETRDDMWLEIYRSEPDKMFLLHAPLFHKAPGGYITLTAKQLRSPALIEEEALNQAEVDLPEGFATRWKGNRAKGVESLKSQLVAAAMAREAALEDRLYGLIAVRFLEVCDGAHTLADGEKPGKSGRPTRLQDGSVVFKWTEVLQDMQHTVSDGKEFTKKDFNHVLKECKITERQFHGIGYRFKEISPESVRLLQRMVAGASREEEESRSAY